MRESLNKIIEDIKKTSWYPQGGEAKLVYTLPPHKAILEIKKIFGVNCPLSITYLRGGYMHIFWSRPGMKKMADFFLEKQKKKPKFIDEVEKGWEKADKIFRQVITRILKTNLRELELPDIKMGSGINNNILQYNNLRDYQKLMSLLG